MCRMRTCGYLLTLCLFLTNLQPALSTAASVPLGPVEPQFFGLHIHRAVTTTPWPSVPFGSWRLWDARVTWADLEATPGAWNFASLDRLVELAEQHDVELLLPLGMTPVWASARPEDSSYYGPGRNAEPKSLDDWRRYVRTVATRYKGRISAYEIWNEPNLKGFFSGTPAKMVELAEAAYQVLKEVDSGVTIVSPSSGGGGPGRGGQGWLDDYLRLGGGEYADVIGYHFYVPQNPPEKMLPLIAEIQQIMKKHGVENKPLWNTETGWDIVSAENPLKQGVLDEETAAAYLVRAFLLNRSAGVGRLYWYAWDNGKMGLASADGRTLKKATVAAYVQAVRWLTGASLLGCGLEPGSNWVCRLDRGKGDESLVMWSTEMGGWGFPPDWKGAMITDLQGREWEAKGRGVAVGPSPVLLRPVR